MVIGILKAWQGDAGLGTRSIQRDERKEGKKGIARNHSPCSLEENPSSWSLIRLGWTSGSFYFRGWVKGKKGHPNEPLTLLAGWKYIQSKLNDPLKEGLAHCSSPKGISLSQALKLLKNLTRYDCKNRRSTEKPVTNLNTTCWVADCMRWAFDSKNLALKSEIMSQV